MNRIRKRAQRVETDLVRNEEVLPIFLGGWLVSKLDGLSKAISQLRYLMTTMEITSTTVTNE